MESMEILIKPSDFDHAISSFSGICRVFVCSLLFYSSAWRMQRAPLKRVSSVWLLTQAINKWLNSGAWYTAQSQQSFQLKMFNYACMALRLVTASRANKSIIWPCKRQLTTLNRHKLPNHMTNGCSAAIWNGYISHFTWHGRWFACATEPMSAKHCPQRQLNI